MNKHILRTTPQLPLLPVPLWILQLLHVDQWWPTHRARPGGDASLFFGHRGLDGLRYVDRPKGAKS